MQFKEEMKETSFKEGYKKIAKLTVFTRPSLIQKVTGGQENPIKKPTVNHLSLVITTS